MLTPLHAHRRSEKGVPSHVSVGVCLCFRVDPHACARGHVFTRINCNSCWGGGKDCRGELSVCGAVWSWRNANNRTHCSRHLHFTCMSCFSARVKWPNEAATTPSSATRAACTLTCGTPKTAKSWKTARILWMRQLSGCPRRRRRERSYRRRSSTVWRAAGTAPVEKLSASTSLHPSQMAHAGIHWSLRCIGEGEWGKGTARLPTPTSAKPRHPCDYSPSCSCE